VRRRSDGSVLPMVAAPDGQVYVISEEGIEYEVQVKTARPLKPRRSNWALSASMHFDSKCAGYVKHFDCHGGKVAVNTLFSKVADCGARARRAVRCMAWAARGWRHAWPRAHACVPLSTSARRPSFAFTAASYGSNDVIMRRLKFARLDAARDTGPQVRAAARRAGLHPATLRACVCLRRLPPSCQHTPMRR
jgi:hypothetical protein